MSKYCVYCGSTIRENDKFCITCGKPLLSDLSKSEKQSEEEIAEDSTEKKPDKKEKDKKKSKKEEVAEVEEEKKEERVVKELPEDVKHQIDLKLQLDEINVKKKALDNKLKDLLKASKSEQFDLDFDYSDGITIKLEAVKTLITELKQEENDVKQQMTGKFILDQIDFDIQAKTDQLRNLTREFKLKKIRDKDVYMNLKTKYKKQLIELETEKADLLAGIRMWIQEIREDKDETGTERKYNKARFSSKEITEEEYKRIEDELAKKEKLFGTKIETLKKLSKIK